MAKLIVCASCENRVEMCCALTLDCVGAGNWSNVVEIDVPDAPTAAVVEVEPVPVIRLDPFPPRPNLDVPPPFPCGYCGSCESCCYGQA